MGEPSPILTLLTDFGLRDWYVAAVKAVLLQHCPAARIVDITHDVPAGDIRGGSILLERAVASFPAGAVHVGVVDPTVGSSRRVLVIAIHGQTVVCPDNGLITWALQRHGPTMIHELTWRPEQTSSTFHGRDILAPAAALLAGCTLLSSLAKPIADPILLGDLVIAGSVGAGRIIHIDHFGNATTNVPASLVRDQRLRFSIGLHDLGALRNTYADVPSGQPLVLIGSSELLEIACRDVSAAERLNLKVGDPLLTIG